MHIKNAFFYALFFLSGALSTFTPAIFSMEQPESSTSEKTAALTPLELLRSGEKYYFGQNLEYTKAREFFEQAANQKTDPCVNVLARLYLGEMYYYSLGVKEDHLKALDYFEQVEAQTIEPGAKALARRYLGQIYYLSKHITVDYLKAHTYFLQATEHPKAQADAQQYLGLMYYFGQGVAIDYSKAREYFEMAANQTKKPKIQARAQYYLGLIYNLGQSVAVDNVKAREYFQQAAKQKKEPQAKKQAQEHLGPMNYLCQGITPTNDPTDAMNATIDPQECFICADGGELVGLPCANNHGPVIHSACLKTFLEQDMPCPMCRGKLYKISESENKK
ncbi:hypothetical protein CVU75_00200 [Candidatus Dependentiae bacterium HGW-Dependentiae-1]|nr:MAG: hypothetical protein CVU75_00200 [Candidatus Dependentiae bacterium HGW-Dependentiae-1]